MLDPSFSSVNRRLVAMLRIIIYMVSWILGVLTVGCSGLGLSQQSRLEIPEPVVSMIVRPQGPFFSSSPVVFTHGADGALSLHGFPTVVEKWAYENYAPDDTVLADLHDALLPFLVPSCEATR